MITSIISYLYIATIILLFVISIISTAKRSTTNQTAGIIIVLLNWLFFYGSFVAFMMYSGNIIFLPHLFRTAHIASLLYLPLSYLYISQSFIPRKLSLWNLLHLLPLLLFLIDYFPFFIKSGEEKIALYQHLSFLQRDLYFKEGWFMPSKSHVLIRYVQMICYWLLQYRLFQKSISLGGSVLLKENPDQIKWIRLFMYSQLFIILPPLSTLLIGWETGTRFLIVVSSLFAAFIQCYYLLSHPEILYGLKGAVVESSISPGISQNPPEESNEQTIPRLPNTSPAYYMSESILDSIQTRLDEYMHTHRGYLMPGYSLAELASSTGYSIHQVSGFINKRYGMNFYGYINQYRIEYCIERLKMKEYMGKTLEAIANESGFQSRTTFIRAFKNHTGLTPTHFIKTHLDEQKPVL